MKYPKINTLFMRDEKTHKIIQNKICREEFKNIELWEISEKIDGTNIRIEMETKIANIYSGGVTNVTEVRFKGREDESDKDIPKPLLEYLKQKFTVELLKNVFPDSTNVTLFGEGYGNNIQSIGRKYRHDVSFILFDVYVDGWWLERNNVEDVALKLVTNVVPSFGIMPLNIAIEFLKQGFESQVAKEKIPAEGIVARCHPQMLFRDKTPIMWKLKAKDYR